MTALSFRSFTLFAATVLLAAAALGAALTANAVALSARADAMHAAGSLMVRVIAPATTTAVTDAAAILRDIPGISGARPMDGARAADLLGAWGGAPVDPAALPALRLVEARRTAGTAPDAAIAAALASSGIRAEIYGAPPDSGDGARAARIAISAGALAAGILALALLLTFDAAAGAMAPSLAVLADLGLPRGAALSLVGRNAALFALGAGILASLACAFVAPGVLRAMGEHLSVHDMLSRISPAEIALPLLAPLTAAAAAAIGARMGAARAYDRADRLG